MDTMLQDLRFALRLFRKHPGPIGITIAGLGLAIGVVTAVFSVVNASLLRPFGMDDPSSIVSVGGYLGHGRPYWPYSVFEQMQAETALLRVEAMQLRRARLQMAATDEAYETRLMLFVSGSYLQTLGGRPHLGRSLQPADDTRGAPAVGMLSHHFWSTRFGGDPAIVGRTVRLNDSLVTVVGVLDRAFTGPTDDAPTIFVPFSAFTVLGFGPLGQELVEVVGRLAPGTTMSAAQASLNVTVSRIVAAPAAEAMLPGARRATVSTNASQRRSVTLHSAASPITGPDSTYAYLAIGCIFTIVGLILALACANTANLLLAGAVTRRREIGVRLALGSTRGRLIRQMVSESMLLALMAAGLGFVCSTWFAPALAAAVGTPEVHADVDARVFVFAVAVAVICGLGAGLSPARFGARGDVLAATKSQSAWAGQGQRSSRVRTSFVGFQAAVSILMLVLAALLTRTAIAVSAVEIGFDADNLAGFDLSAPSRDFARDTYLDVATATIRDLPMVEHVSLAQTVPFGRLTEHDRFSAGGRSYELSIFRTDASFFMTAGLRIQRGRPFTPDEAQGDARVVLISDSVARAFFPGQDPIGRSVSAVPGDNGRYQPAATIIGVVGDAFTGRVDAQEFGTLYFPLSRTSTRTPGFLIRASNPGAAVPAVEAALRRVDPRVQFMTTVVGADLESYLRSQRRLAWLAGPIAVLALLLSALGMYGVTAFVVGQRTQEVSVRIAMGATTANIMRLLMTDSLRPILIGLVVGLGAALMVSRLVASQFLSLISPHDPLAIGGAIAVLMVSALVAVIAPARRASRAAPASVLRQV